MTISVWRYSHFALAAVASLFLVVASVTGAILALEPITHQAKGHAVADLGSISLATTMEKLQQRHAEVLTLAVEKSGFVKAAVLTDDLESRDLYIDPSSGETLGEVPQRPEIYIFATNLHRSLFLKGLGRFLMGLASFLLLLIALTGLFLLARRQGGFRRVFAKVHKEYTALRYHVILSRWLWVPLVILATTGVYLSLEKFGLLPQQELYFQDKNGAPASGAAKLPQEIALFHTLTLEEVRSVEFPFSDAPEEVYHLALQDREIRVNQASGEVVSEAVYPLFHGLGQWSWALHTGEGNVPWSLVLGLASASILYFIYSGSVMSLKRLRKKGEKAGNHPAATAAYVVLVGSETGHTQRFALRFCAALERLGHTVHLTSLNNYGPFPKAQGLIIFAATYGAGDAPANARRFVSRFMETRPLAPLKFAVVGFGSLNYPDYCSFAIKVDALLHRHKDFVPWMPLTKINERSEAAFLEWAQQWNIHTGLQLQLEGAATEVMANRSLNCLVLERTPLNADHTFLLRLRPDKGTSFRSGDLLQVVPPGADKPRAYSMARVAGDILLAVKRHPKGKCSSYLATLKKGDLLHAQLQENHGFHFPESAPMVWMVANGTGLAPFIGMLQEHRNSRVRLTWGGRSQDSFEAYRTYLNGSLQELPDKDVQLALSQENGRTYVQALLAQQQEEVALALTEGCVFLLCGSLRMQQGVLDVLESICQDKLQRPLGHFEDKGQLLMDCY